MLKWVITACHYNLEKYVILYYTIHTHVYPNSYSFTLEQAATYKARTTLKPQLTPKQLKALKLHCVVSLTVMPEGSVKCTKL